MERPRRRGIGKTLPVGWIYMKPPDANLKAHLLLHVKNRRKKQEQEFAERAARAKERRNEEERKAWHKEQIVVCETKLEQINTKRKELDDLRNNLYVQLKEILMKNDGGKILQDEGLLKQIMMSQKVKQDESETSQSPGTSVARQVS
uniref:BZIP domain-containing protein n=1 Tax=Syphacia muris TaxID=451379 RepID=A0A0N5ATL3_9BILA